MAYIPALETIGILETDINTVVGSYTGRKWSIAYDQMSECIRTDKIKSQT